MKHFKNGLLRAVIPFVIMTGIAYSLQSSNEISQAEGTFFAGIIIAAVSGFSVIYTIELWTFAKQFFVHFICMLLTVFPTLIFSGWFKVNGLIDVAIIFGIFLLFGLIFASIGYFLFTKVFNNK